MGDSVGTLHNTCMLPTLSNVYHLKSHNDHETPTLLI